MALRRADLEAQLRAEKKTVVQRHGGRRRVWFRMVERSADHVTRSTGCRRVRHVGIWAIIRS
jgi:hypothetical protein